MGNVKGFYKTYLKPDGIIEWMILSLMILTVGAAVLLASIAYFHS